MSAPRHCESCNNDQERLTAGNRDAYYLCLADIGPTWFRDYSDKCLACALLAETGHGRPESCLELQTKFRRLPAAAPAADDINETSSVSNPVSNEGHTGDIWSK